MCIMVPADFFICGFVIKHLGPAHVVKGQNLGNCGVFWWFLACFGVSQFVLSIAQFCYVLYKGNTIYLYQAGVAGLFAVKNMETFG